MRTRNDDGSLPLVRSALLPGTFRHGFSTRAGGVSEAPYDALNLGAKWGDDPARVEENRRRLLEALGLPPPLFVARQVHGNVIRRVRMGDDPERLARTEADGLCTDAAGLALGVFVADCVPILIADPRTGACAAVHAGWRGTVLGIAGEAVRTLERELGARPADLRVALGPAIGPCCFEVGPEVVAAFEGAFPGADEIVRPSPRGRADRRHVDLRIANRQQLIQAGVSVAAIDLGAPCTSCDGGRFYSFRRDGSATGQLMGVIGRPV